MGLLNRIEELEKELAELKCKVKEGPKFPEYGDIYWCIDAEGIVYVNTFEGIQADRNILEIGNVFKTAEEAEFAVEKLKVEAELRKYSKLFEYGKFNYYLFFDIDGNSFRTDFTSYCPPQGAIYFESEEKAQQAVYTVGEERIKKYLFGVEEL